jgi:SSS family solute:Na+ symporter
MQMTGAIYLGGAGAVIIGGLYWKRGTTAAAWSATITGCILATTGIVIRQMNPEFPLDGMKISFVTALISLSVYLLVSLLGLGGNFDLEKMLHRGKYAIEKGDEPEVSKKAEAGHKSKWVHVLSRLGLSEEFNKKDRLIWFSSFVWGAFWSVVFVLGTIYNILFDVPDHIWLKFWYFWILLGISLCILVTVWLTWGGILDMKKMYSMLDKMKRDVSDDGSVQDDHQNSLQEANKS